MPTRDLIHDAVKSALIKNGWTITADPYVLEYEDLTLFADLAAERSIAAEREGRKIVVEIKSFLGRRRSESLRRLWDNTNCIAACSMPRSRNESCISP